MTRMQLVRALASWRLNLTAYRDLESAYRISLKSLGRRYLELHDEIADLDAMIAAIVNELAPNLVARKFDRPHPSGTASLTAGDNPERLRSEASFASLCGVSPVPASSGKTVRRRLNRGGDRAANLIARCTSSPSVACEPTRGPRTSRSPTCRRAFQTRRHSSPEALSRQPAASALGDRTPDEAYAIEIQQENLAA
jgi:transposase